MQSASFSMSYSLFTYAFEYEGEPAPPPNPDPDPPDPNPIPDPTGDMNNNCCEDIKKILARMERQLKEVHKVIDPPGFKKGEYQFPANWIYPTNDTKPIKFEDLPDFLGAIGRLIDRRIGGLPQIVKVKDANPAEEGDQEVNLIVNSLADFGKLTLEYLIASQGDVGATQLLSSAILFEAGMTHQVSIVTERIVRAIAEYLDFESLEKSEKFKMAFNPKELPKEGESLEKYLPRLLRPHEQQVEAMYWAGGQSEKDKLNEILKKVSIAAAALSSTQPLDKLVEETQQLERLKRLLMMREMQDRQGIPDLDKFFDDSEKGYPSSKQDPIVKEKPYGFNPTDKPKFKKTTKGSKKTRYKRVREGNK